MTDRINGVFVTLEENIRIDEIEHLMNALRMVKGVIDVSPNVVDSMDHVAKIRAKTELTNKLLDALRDN